VVRDLIADGEDLQGLEASIEEIITDFNEDRTQKIEIRETLDSLSQVINGSIAQLNSGLVLMEFIEIVEIESPITYGDDSLATSFAIPLSIDESFFNYEVNIVRDTNTFATETGTFQVGYELFRDIDDDRNVLIRAQNIQIINHSFDSLDACEENCLDGQSIFTFYF